MDAETVTCTFEITFEEFREAVLAVQQAIARRQQARRSRRVAGGAVVVGITAAVAVPLVMIAGRFADPFSGASATPSARWNTTGRASRTSARRPTSSSFTSPITAC